MTADLDGLVGVESGVTSVVGATDPWVFVLMRGFAGPQSDWRAFALADEPGGAVGVRRGDTFECGTGSGYQPSNALVVDNEHGAKMTLLPSAGGVTLGELLDESAAQNARLDACYAVHVMAALLPPFLGNGSSLAGGAISVDNVLLGFDGSVHARGDAPWWPRRRVARLEAGWMTRTDDGESVRLFGELAAELFASRRYDVRTGLSFPGHEGTVRKEARALVQWLLEAPVMPDVDSLYNTGPDAPDFADVNARVDVMRRLVDPVTPLALATLVRQLFPERARRDALVLERVLA